MMFSCRLSAGNRWQVVCCLLSILTLLDASTVNTPTATHTTNTITTQSISTQWPTTITITIAETKNNTQLTTHSHPVVSSASAISTASTIENKDLGTTNTVKTSNTTPADLTMAMNDSTIFTDNSTTESYKTTSFQKTSTITTTAKATESQVNPTQKSALTTIPTNITTEENKKCQITCETLVNQNSNLEVVCFEYNERTNCQNLKEDDRRKLESLLCDDSSLTLYNSEVNPQCILWIPTALEKSKAFKERQKQFNDNLQLKWGHVSDHQTRSQKIMIALITCGVLIAILILAGYFLSNTTRWSPGRQRLGEDYTETDSQGNTLVCVSTYDQNKPNSGAKENGKGQAITPSTTNGHSTKKQAVSDTEL
ncbi:hematopoietic progenitor cell antigen CD34 isoform X1 [Pelobates cultripes]|uniref:Hematopoietic progenitor cell antigen CD34 isoform X1 n=1 Tax=Pelobates cultripes TaxID=61616 RepID=A0AAD1QZN5_PELCU|nr:hematopoietic progenitor cell antigen CD34 isoform X1 [Pelobates cultripes]